MQGTIVDGAGADVSRNQKAMGYPVFSRSTTGRTSTHGETGRVPNILSLRALVHSTGRGGVSQSERPSGVRATRHARGLMKVASTHEKESEIREQILSVSPSVDIAT